MEMLAAISRIIAGVIPIGCVIIVIWYNRRTMKRIDEKLQEMHRIDRRAVMRLMGSKVRDLN